MEDYTPTLPMDTTKVHHKLGHGMSWFSWEHRTIMGFSDTKPKVGDRILSKLKSGKTAMFEITSVRCCIDPTDQFFLDVKDIGYMKE